MISFGGVTEAYSVHGKKDAIVLRYILGATSLAGRKQQISADFTALHNVGVIWGDAKRGNIFIETESNQLSL